VSDLPKYRDVSVHKPDVPADTSQSEAGSSRSDANLVTVMGFDKNDVLFRSDKVGTVQWRDSDGKIVGLLVRLRPDIWGFSHRGDDDWEANLKIYGNPDCP
jgi:hypothetical protein